NALSLPALRLKADKAKCIECKKCSKVCPMSLDVMEMVQAESMRNSECILCGSCVDTCSQGAIKYSLGRLGKSN
ncbi:MAG: 4Fe-4S binding protein, partial [Phycisphaerales bacterium]